MNLFSCKLELTPKYHDLKNWNEDTQKVFGEHAKYLETALQNQVALFVGRTDDTPAKNYGLFLIQAESLQAAENFATQDPVIKNGIMTVTVQPFRLLRAADDLKKYNVW
jgi:uncharacterized protein YciI